ncbi:hypothetical protein BVRB_5g102050 isoform B [Beta vulgaris subsp. vulgaris]|nr:hypothetical protein BVRB_5g102050 isoform B [Beta vulgaris subsp. vulgaris]
MCLCPPTAASPTARGAGGDTNRFSFKTSFHFYAFSWGWDMDTYFCLWYPLI